MESSFWQTQWREGRIAFHRPEPNPWLVAHLDRLELGGDRRRVLVPLCGKSIDLGYLASHGAEVVGVELVDAAARAFFEEASLTPARTVDGPLVRYEAAGVEIVVGDFFALGVEDVGTFDAFFDRAAIVALPPEMRARYATTLRALTPRARGIFVTFEHDLAEGPPFVVDAAEIAERFPDRAIEALGARDASDVNPGVIGRGATFVRESALLATPRA
jgi:thiopurine S-methyltransferase